MGFPPLCVRLAGNLCEDSPRVIRTSLDSGWDLGEDENYPLSSLSSGRGGSRGADDVALGSGADEVEGIARHERDRFLRRRVEDPDVVGRDEPDVFDDERLGTADGLELHRVADGDVLQATEEAVPVPRDR